MTLIIVHYHLRPGGIRRVIELVTPPLVRQIGGRAVAVVLASGEPADPKWEQAFRRNLEATPVRVFIAPSFKYLSEQRQRGAQIRKSLRLALKNLLAGALPENTLVWAHNLGVGRNLLLSRELAAACAARGLTLVSHHHDWWFDNRWRRWPEMRRFGLRTLSAAARAIFPAAPSVRHLAINRADASQLERRLFDRAGWLPNPADHGTPPPAARVREARAWLRNGKYGVRPPSPGYGAARSAEFSGAPVWILPCRLLRRKNISEALLLTRWLRPEAWLVTTGGASSAEEQSYFEALAAAARRHRWPLRLGVLQGDETHKPSVAELLAASEAVLLTSIQEGFGLPYLEAATARRPLIARSIPNIAPDLNQFGFRFPQTYDEILIDPHLFNWDLERNRQEKLFRVWRARLPGAVLKYAGQPVLLATGNRPRPIPFSRLTLTAQLEVLAQPAALSWAQCAPLNPFLSVWRQRAAAGALQTTPWPRAAGRWLSGPAYARSFAEIVFRPVKEPPSPAAGHAVQQAFLREKLRAEHLFPLLWEP